MQVSYSYSVLITIAIQTLLNDVIRRVWNDAIEKHKRSLGVNIKLLKI